MPRYGEGMWILLARVAFAEPVVLESGRGARLPLDRTPAAEGEASVWLRCTWSTTRSGGPESTAACGGEGTLRWTLGDGALGWTLAAFTPEPACPSAAALEGARWTGRVEDWTVEALTLEAEVGDRVAGDLLAELGDALQRLVIPVPEERLRDGAVWARRVIEDGAGLTGDIADRWTATRDGPYVRLAWEQEGLLTGAGSQPTVERWSGALRFEPAAVLATGRWESDRPLRIARDDRWVESVARCTGEVRPAGARD